MVTLPMSQTGGVVFVCEARFSTKFWLKITISIFKLTLSKYYKHAKKKQFNAILLDTRNTFCVTYIHTIIYIFYGDLNLNTRWLLVLIFRLSKRPTRTRTGVPTKAFHGPTLPYQGRGSTIASRGERNVISTTREEYEWYGMKTDRAWSRHTCTLQRSQACGWPTSGKCWRRKWGLEE